MARGEGKKGTKEAKSASPPCPCKVDYCSYGKVDLPRLVWLSINSAMRNAALSLDRASTGAANNGENDDGAGTLWEARLAR